MIRRAKASIDNLQDAFEIENRRNAATLRRLWNAARLGDLDSGELEPVHRISHEIKGQGSTFGYELLSSVAESLCAVITKNLRSRKSKGLCESIEAHVATIEFIAQEALTGSGGRQGEMLVQRLRQIGAVIGT